MSRLDEVTGEYGELLIEFCNNNKLLELFEKVILDDIQERESYYRKNKKYPEQCDRLMKLKNDLLTVRAEETMKGVVENE